MKSRKVLYLFGYIFFIAMYTLFLDGCSRTFSTPSVSDAIKVIETRIQQMYQADQSAGLAKKAHIKLVTLEKTNGQKAEVMGVMVYKLSYQAEIEFLDDCWWGIHPFEAIDRPLNPFFPMGEKHVKKGQREKVTGTIDFEMTEKGWIGSSVVP